MFTEHTEGVHWFLEDMLEKNIAFLVHVSDTILP